MKFPTEYDNLPESLQNEARKWVEDGVLPGKLLQACLRDKFVEAHALAGWEDLSAIAKWLHWECPAVARNVAKWHKQGGGNGIG